MKTILICLALCSLVSTGAEAKKYAGAISINPSQDAKILADWYSKFGVETRLYEGGYYGVFKTAGGTFIFGIHPKKEGAPEKSSMSVAIVFRINNYKKYISNLEKNGLAPESTERDDSGSFAHFRDPDGNEMTVWGK